MDSDKLKSVARAVIDTEGEAVAALAPRIDDAFVAACRLLLACQGRVVVTGMGKSGHIGGKIAATLASTGTPAFFLHPAEANHGDLGMITASDLVIAISKSGESQEIASLLPMLKRLGTSLVTMTGNPESTLAQAAEVNLDVSVDKEACSLGLAPTASTTATLVMGDALAVSLLESRGFTEADFARAHPGGTLGRKLLLRIADLMHTGEAIPRVPLGTTLAHALVEVTRTGLGMTTIVDDSGRLQGIFTDGDLRRALDAALDIHSTTIDTVMTRDCWTAPETMLAAEALHMMDHHKINALAIVDDDHRVTGALNMHDLLRAGVV